jgi:hypothetical protein
MPSSISAIETQERNSSAECTSIQSTKVRGDLRFDGAPADMTFVSIRYTSKGRFAHTGGAALGNVFSTFAAQTLEAAKDGTCDSRCHSAKPSTTA